MPVRLYWELADQVWGLKALWDELSGPASRRKHLYASAAWKALGVNSPIKLAMDWRTDQHASMEELSAEDVAREVIRYGVNSLLQRAEVRVAFAWGTDPKTPASLLGLLPGSPGLVMRGQQPLAAIAVQLASHVSWGNHLASCSGCGAVVERKHRRPRRDRAVWCDNCGAKGGYKQAKADSRLRLSLT